MALIINQGGGGKKIGNVRSYQAYGIIGSKGKGKSSLARARVDEFMKVFSKKWHQEGLNKMPRGFIHDPSGSAAFADIKTIEQVCKEDGFKLKNPFDFLRLKDIHGDPYWKNGLVKYQGSRSSQMEQMHDYVFEFFVDGICVFDECTFYIKSNPSDWQTKILTNHRNRGVEVIYLWHKVSTVPNYFAKSDDIYSWDIFKTGEHFESPKDSDLRRYSARRTDIFNAVQALKEMKETRNYIQPHITVI